MVPGKVGPGQEDGQKWVKGVNCIVTDRYCSEHFVVYTNTDILCCTPETNIPILPQLKKYMSGSISLTYPLT